MDDNSSPAFERRKYLSIEIDICFHTNQINLGKIASVIQLFVLTYTNPHKEVGGYL